MDQHGSGFSAYRILTRSTRLNLFESAPDLDHSVFIGQLAAETYVDHENLPSRVRVRVDPAKVDQVLTVLVAAAMVDQGTVEHREVAEDEW